jgi:hypothetical protein
VLPGVRFASSPPSIQQAVRPALLSPYRVRSTSSRLSQRSNQRSQPGWGDFFFRSVASVEIASENFGKAHDMG